MKKPGIVLLTMAAAALGLAAFAACKDDETPPMEHTHAYSSWVVVDEPTCTKEGLRERTCSCGEKETEAIAALGHSAGEAVRENEKAPTCTTAGSYEEVITCLRCREEVSRKTVEVAPLDHTPGEAVRENEVAATCTTAGYTSYKTCLRCGYTTRETIPAAGHTWGEWVETTAATCTTAGEQKHTCSACGVEEKEEIAVDPTAHKPDTTDYIADEKEHWFACSLCGKELKNTTYAVHDYTGGVQNCKTCGVTDSKYFNFTLLDDGTYSTTLNYNDLPTGDIVVPSYHEGKQITTLPNASFSGYAALYVYQVDWNITSIKISEGITTIADMAFLYTNNIKVYIPESVVLIDYQAFGGVTGEIIFESLENWLVQKCEWEATPSGNIITPAGNLIPLDDLTPDNALTYLNYTYTSYRWTKQTND